VTPETELAALREIVERVMTQHWDMQACGCWLCEAGRASGCRPRDVYPSHSTPTHPYIGPVRGHP
jgi:hypothetical protein